MYYFLILKIAIKNLFANKFRTLLTMLGLIIGVSSIVMITSIGAGAQSLIVNEINSFGTDKIGVLPGNTGNGPPAAILGIIVDTLTYSDFLVLRDEKQNPFIKKGSAYVTQNIQLSHYDFVQDISFFGVTPEFLDVEGLQMEAGNFFSKDDLAYKSRSVILGADLKNDIFPNQDPIGKTVKLDGKLYHVVGVLSKKGGTTFQNYDTGIILPFSTAQENILGIKYVHFLRFQVTHPEHAEQAKQIMESILRDRHEIEPGQEDDFTIRSSVQALSLFEDITGAIKAFLAGIAGLSLLVGGIGVMNILLISVQEKMWEVGLKKSIGATRFDILIQFLIESVLLCSIGGAIGFLFGGFVSFMVALVAQFLEYNWTFSIPLNAAIIGFGVTFLIGIIFGMYPAVKASRLDAIDALRYE